MTAWTAGELDEIDATEELDIASFRPDGTTRPPVTIWVVRVDDDVYVRSAYGPENGWFRRALASGAGHVSVGSVEKDVTFAEPVAEPARIDAAYHAKYDEHGPEIVGTVVGARAATVTVRLVPRDQHPTAPARS